jgi:NDP-sugar pyrophosphorylase family protein
MSEGRATDIRELTAVVLAGGLGTRLRSVVQDRPKVLAEVNGKPFLAHLLEMIESAGIRRAVICTGYQSKQIVAEFGEWYGRLALEYTVESRLLGTAGALRLALPLVRSDPVLVMNGDSFMRADLSGFYRRHFSSGALNSILLAHCGDTARFGKVETDDAGAVSGFIEKSDAGGPGWINAGIYLLSRRLIQTVAANAVVSLERDVFPRFVGRNFFGFRCPGEFIDIGTPDSYQLAGAFMQALMDRRQQPNPAGR